VVARWGGYQTVRFFPDWLITRSFFVDGLSHLDVKGSLEVILSQYTYINKFVDIPYSTTDYRPVTTGVDGGAGDYKKPFHGWYASSAEWALRNGIVHGTSDTTFGPHERVTREQAATMLLNYCKYFPIATPAPSQDKYGDDAEISPWAEEAVYVLTAMGIIAGDEKGNFNPKNNITKAEATVLLMRLLDLQGGVRLHRGDFEHRW
jgi:hypothetical protein